MLSIAMRISHRLYVMDQGRIAQCGTPREVYEEPADAYVADFLGVANLLPARYVTAGRLEVAGREGMAGKRVVVIVPDSGERYMSLPFFAP